ncbi:MAG: AAA family ATPase [Puniceicoccales bacterium]|jgi:predicted metal-dependent phosphoesterase TrpH/energy-coupling factor transporter ATP-binding protein EcfA2|nr:AAA family ATPase [Puniceicoccales bacterium]
MTNNSIHIGSKWWKFDFHTHTPASHDYNSPLIVHEDWLRSAMSAGLDCVVVSDHNSGEWIDALKTKNNELRGQAAKPDWYRDLIIFPGVEITVADSANRIHLLAVFDPSRGTSNITAVLGACGISSGFGDEKDIATNKGFLDVVKAINEAGGIAIPAHIDVSKGLLHEKTSLTPDLKRSLDSVFAAEFCNLHKIAVDDTPTDLKKAVERLAKIAGSDAHKPENIGKHTSWLKMGTPSIEGLRLALADFDFCVKNQAEDPNRNPDVFLTQLSIENMSVCGSVPTQPFVATLHPHFNSLIGGRGTGKSTLVESIRLATRRDQSLPNDSRIKEKIERFARLSRDKGIMREGTEILLNLQRRGVLYRLRWRKDGNGSALDEKQGATWVPVEAGNIHERFPISIYSQKQIEELASNPRGLLEIIDRAPEVNRAEWQSTWDNATSQFLQLKERERDLSRRLATEKQIRVKLADVEKDLKQYEEKGHGEILKNYQKRTQQRNGLPRKEDFDVLSQQISNLAPGLLLSDFPAHLFEPSDDTCAEIQAIHEQATRELQHVAEQLQKLADEVTAIRQRWETANNNSKFAEAYRQSVAAYKSLTQAYAEKQNALNLTTYSGWVNQRNQLQQQLRELANIRTELETTQTQIKTLLEQFKTLRSELLQKRTAFVQTVIGKNPYVRMEFVALGDVSTLENDYRDYLELGNTFNSSVYEQDNKHSLLQPLIQWESNKSKTQELPNLLANAKAKTIKIAEGAEHGADARFDARLVRLRIEKPQAFDRLEAWFPEDLLRVKYAPSPENATKFNDLERGSAGQKAAAILAFLLSYGDEPLVIDQPEDDLDNALIYDLIVKQIHENKNRRQLIIATHNPNIVVNGDSELVHVLKFNGGQIQIDRQGGLEEFPVRESICTIMEGGKKAFEQRYKRISLEDKNHV